MDVFGVADKIKEGGADQIYTRELLDRFEDRIRSPALIFGAAAISFESSGYQTSGGFSVDILRGEYVRAKQPNEFIYVGRRLSVSVVREGFRFGRRHLVGFMAQQTKRLEHSGADAKRLLRTVNPAHRHAHVDVVWKSRVMVDRYAKFATENLAGPAARIESVGAGANVIELTSRF